MTRVLILGGTTEASRLAVAVSAAGLAGVYSYAGRTKAPGVQPLPTRIAGFGGAAGLVGFLRREGITHVVDATHPFAAQMSRNACAACADTGVPLIALERRPWTPEASDLWHLVPDLAAAVAALQMEPTRVFLAIGRQHLAAFAGAPQHAYLLRLVDPPDAPLPLPRTEVVVARGPFDRDGDIALMRGHGTQLIVAKNAGGEGARAKIDAARHLGLPVILIDRPALPPRLSVETIAQVMEWFGCPHPARLGV